jgi:hypothetical protein
LRCYVSTRVWRWSLAGRCFCVMKKDFRPELERIIQCFCRTSWVRYDVRWCRVESTKHVGPAADDTLPPPQRLSTRRTFVLRSHFAWFQYWCLRYLYAFLSLVALRSAQYRNLYVGNELGRSAISVPCMESQSDRSKHMTRRVEACESETRDR